MANKQYPRSDFIEIESETSKGSCFVEKHAKKEKRMVKRVKSLQLARLQPQDLVEEEMYPREIMQCDLKKKGGWTWLTSLQRKPREMNLCVVILTLDRIITRYDTQRRKRVDELG